MLLTHGFFNDTPLKAPKLKVYFDLEIFYSYDNQLFYAAITSVSKIFI